MAPIHGRSAADGPDGAWAEVPLGGEDEGEAGDGDAGGGSACRRMGCIAFGSALVGAYPYVSRAACALTGIFEDAALLTKKIDSS
jgi:hypothetical protein